MAIARGERCWKGFCDRPTLKRCDIKKQIRRFELEGWAAPFASGAKAVCRSNRLGRANAVPPNAGTISFIEIVGVATHYLSESGN